MTEARIERVPLDTTLARAHLARGREFLTDVAHTETLAAGQVLAYTACIAAMEATLAAVGRRISPGSGYHRLLIEEVESLLQPERADLLENVDEARELRAEVSYHAGVISKEEVIHLTGIATELLDEAARFIAERE